ncbi:MAG: putative extracellular nuclease [Thermoleophilia bacterium]|nr:putative extracellular nuclease [Thermoleophilia bacterium]
MAACAVFVAFPGIAAGAPPPTVALHGAPLYIAGEYPFSGQSSDDGGTTIHVMVVGATSVTACPAAPSDGWWQCNWNTTSVPDGVYEVRARATATDGSDSEWDVATVVVDNGPPVASFHSFTGLTNPQVHSAIGTTVNVDLTSSGSFRVRIDASDLGAGISHVAFPSLGASWLPANGMDDPVGPTYEISYSWSSGAAEPGMVHAVAYDLVGRTTTVAFEIRHAAAVGNDVVVIGGHGTLEEAHPAAKHVFSVTLSSEPQQDVGIVLGASPDVVLDLPYLTFTSANWNIPQQVAVSVVDDAIAEGTHLATIHLNTNTLDAYFATVDIPDVTIAVIDDDTPGIIVSGLPLVLDEGAAANANVLEFELPSEPIANVLVAVTGDEQVVVDPVTLVFTPANWNVRQLVTVRPVADDIDEASPHPGTISLAISSADPFYDGFDAGETSVLIEDDDDTALASDTTPPIGASLGFTGGDTSAVSLVVSIDPGDDPGSGVATWSLQYSVALLAANACVAFGNWVDVAHDVGSASFAPSSGTCTRLRLIVRDNVGNTSTFDSSEVIRTDRVAPHGTWSEVAPEVRGTVTLAGTATDAATRIARVDVRVGEGGPIACTATPTIDHLWSCEWDTSPVPPGVVTLVATIIDVVGNVSNITTETSVGTDRTPTTHTPPDDGLPEDRPPSIRLHPIPQVAWSQRIALRVSVSDDDGMPPQVTFQRRDARHDRGGFGSWRRTPSPLALTVPGATTCVRAIAHDSVGNAATSSQQCTTSLIDDRLLQRRGGWVDVRSRAAFGGSWSRATSRTSELRLTTASAQPRIVVRTCDDCGPVRIMHGSRVLGTYSLARPRPGRIELRLPLLVRPPSVPIRITGARNGAIWIDAVIAPR